MAKTKKNIQSSRDELENNVDGVNNREGSPSKSKEQKSAKPLKRVFKSRANNASVGEMVTAALESLKNDKGVALVTIRKFITANFGVRMSKVLQNNIKNYMADQFEQGKIIMTNNDGDAIKFNMRFNMVVE